MNLLRYAQPVASLTMAAALQRVSETKASLQQEQFKGIDAKYRKQQVELKTVEMGNKDLERYCKGLEKALLAFHSTKMESINQVRFPK